MEELENRYRYLADACPSLATIDRVEHDDAIVFVHGTASCGMVSLKDLFSLAVEGFSVPGPVYRYEHDTYLPITDNSHELVELILDRIRVRRRLLIVAHSRGGLVAVDAALQLAERGFGAEVSVCTLGTPFRGTPLVAFGKKALNVLAKIGEEIATSVPIPVLSALAKAFFYVVESPTLPRGVMAMHEEAEGLAYLKRAAEDVALRSWASAFDVETGDAGFGASIEGILLAAL